MNAETISLQQALASLRTPARWRRERDAYLHSARRLRRARAQLERTHGALVLENAARRDRRLKTWSQSERVQIIENAAAEFAIKTRRAQPPADLAKLATDCVRRARQNYANHLKRARKANPSDLLEVQPLGLQEEALLRDPQFWFALPFDTRRVCALRRADFEVVDELNAVPRKGKPWKPYTDTEIAEQCSLSLADLDRLNRDLRRALTDALETPGDVQAASDVSDEYEQELRAHERTETLDSTGLPVEEPSDEPSAATHFETRVQDDAERRGRKLNRQREKMGFAPLPLEDLVQRRKEWRAPLKDTPWGPECTADVIERALHDSFNKYVEAKGIGFRPLKKGQPRRASNEAIKQTVVARNKRLHAVPRKRKPSKSRRERVGNGWITRPER